MMHDFSGVEGREKEREREGLNVIFYFFESAREIERDFYFFDSASGRFEPTTPA